MNNFVDSMQADDDAVITFNSSAMLRQDFTSDKEKIKSTILSMSAGGTTSVNAGMSRALSAVEGHDCDKQNIIVLICDGDVNCGQATINRCIKDDV